MNDVQGWSLSDKAFFAQSLDEMKGIKQPFYSFLITLTSHHPYYVPKDAAKLDTGLSKARYSETICSRSTMSTKHLASSSSR